MTARVLPFSQSPAPFSENRKTMPRRPPNAELRTREYLTPDEVDQLQHAAASAGRHGNRDATLIMLAYRHGLRVCSFIDFRTKS